MSQQLKFRDASIGAGTSTALNSATQNVLPLNGSRQFLQIEAPAANSAPIYVNYSGPATGGTGPGGVGNAATAGTTGTFEISAGGSITLDHIVPQNPVNVCGTSGDAIVVNEA